ncbi:hypothetical protein SAMN05444278_101236 [Psychroflexus salarius]|uniref:tRNA_anti-like n=1 Tax=Psychroflexus salarius TaxID=1155689 RepID=A0A1M4SMH9_9FLAO|nr:hypothetical protein [Psychroflexus salarius]SHE33416.1 hypothetical protein SAMN05444278_101236 [Psychroflexus salarius]
MSLSKKAKISLGLFVVLLVVGFISYKYVMKPPAVIEDRNVSFEGTSQDVFEKVQGNPRGWQDKVVLISGTITSKDDKGLSLNNNIYCQLKEKQYISINENIRLKGRIIGYDDLLEELKLDQCIIIQNYD